MHYRAKLVIVVFKLISSADGMELRRFKGLEFLVRYKTEHKLSPRKQEREVPGALLELRHERHRETRWW